MLGKIEGRRRRGRQKIRWLDGLTHVMDMNLSKLWEMAMGREAWHAAFHGVTKSQTWLNDWTELNWRGHQRMRWLDCIIHTMDVNLGRLLEFLRDREGFCSSDHVVAKNLTWLGDWTIMYMRWGFPDDSGKGVHLQSRQHRRCRLDPWIRKFPWRRKWQSSPVFFLGKFCGQRSLAGYSPKCHRVGHKWVTEHTPIGI